MFQFRVRYWYDDYEKSAWSAISVYPLALDLDGNFMDNLNTIVVNYTEDILALSSWRAIIKKVEISVRSGLLGAFKTVDTIPLCEIGLRSNKYKFFNDRLYAAVGIDDFSKEVSIQVLKHFDNVPQITGAMEFVANREGKGRVFTAANLENYDVDKCIDMKMSVDAAHDDGLITIRGTVNVHAWPSADVTPFNIYENYSAPFTTGSTEFFPSDDGKTFITAWHENPSGGWRTVSIAPASTNAEKALGWNQGTGLNLDYEKHDFSAASHDGGMEGFVVYLAGTDYYGISKNFITVPKAQRDGSFEIKGVPKGKYILRVANWKVGYDDTYGSIHNLTNGREWQKTSSPVLACAIPTPSPIPHDYRETHERIIDLTSFPSDTFDLDTEVGYGPILIENMSEGVTYDTGSASMGNCRFSIHGYFLDNNGLKTTNEERLAAIACERQKINMKYRSEVGLAATEVHSSDITLITDHNGFFFYAWGLTNNGLDSLGTAGSNAQFKNIKDLYPEIPDVWNPPAGTEGLYNLDPSTGNKTFTHPSPGGNLYDGGLTALYLGNDDDYYIYIQPTPGYSYSTTHTLYVDASNVTSPRPAPYCLILYNGNQDFTKHNRTIVQGTVKDAQGAGVPDVLVCLERNGRQEKTNSLGNYSISIYCPWDATTNAPLFGRVDDDLFTQYTPDYNYIYPPSPTSHTLAVTAFVSGGVGGPFDIYNPYTAPDFTYGFYGGLPFSDRYLKSGGSYRVGVVYEDNYNRKSTVVEGDAFRVPFHTETSSYDKPHIIWEIDGTPPLWATHFRIVRTKESFYSRYVSLKITAVKYVKYNTDIYAPTFTSHANADATHVHLRIPTLFEQDLENADAGALWFLKKENETTFNPLVRDRVRLILDESDSLLRTDGIFDYGIEGTYVDDSDNIWLIVEAPEILREIKPGWLMEAYTPKRTEEIVFYECGECHKILNPHTASRIHSGPNQNQIVGTQPAKGSLVGGDTYWRKRQFSVPEDLVSPSLFIENRNMADSFDSINEDIGRANIKDLDFGQRFYNNKVSWSGLYIPDTKINNLSAFIGVDFQAVDNNFGTVKNLVTVAEVMLAICEFKIQPFYVGKDNVLALSGTTNMGRSDRTLNAANELVQDFGTQHPSSISKDGNFCYGFDARQGVAWRYATNGLTEISQYRMINEFNNIGKDFYAVSSKNNDVLGIFDREFKCYLLTFPELTDDDLDGYGARAAATISFDETKNGWNTYLSYVPEYYGITGQILVSFKDGSLWRHESNTAAKSNFYGVQYNNEIDIVFNRKPRMTKMFFNIEQQSDKLFVCPTITIPANNPYSTGMLSELIANKFTNYEGHWNADFLRDKNDTNKVFRDIADAATRAVTALLRGRVLRGEVIVIKLRLNTQGEDFNLKRIDVGYAPSEETKT